MAGFSGVPGVEFTTPAPIAAFTAALKPFMVYPGPKLVPQVFRITVIGRNATGATFLVGQDHPILQGVKAEVLT